MSGFVTADRQLATHHYRYHLCLSACIAGPICRSCQPSSRKTFGSRAPSLQHHYISFGLSTSLDLIREPPQHHTAAIDNPRDGLPLYKSPQLAEGSLLCETSRGYNRGTSGEPLVRLITVLDVVSLSPDGFRDKG